MVGEKQPFVQNALEQGRFRGLIARACAVGWARVSERTVVRHIDLPPRTRVVAVGGATMGGSGKTPLAIACAAVLARAGARVALVGHAHRAAPMRARIVSPRDSLDEVGDEALVAALALNQAGVLVVVAPTRRAAIAYAALHAKVLVLDGIAQTHPIRCSLALLAVDGAEPWGRARAVAPLGDLRAPRAVLLRACDGVVAIGDAHDGAAIGDADDNVAIDDADDNVAIDDADDNVAIDDADDGAFKKWSARALSLGVRVGDALVGWNELARLRVGLVCALGRPARVVRSLERRGIAVHALVCASNHGPLTENVLRCAARAQTQLKIDLWLATPKCWLHFAPQLSACVANVGGLLHAPPPGHLGMIEHTLSLSTGLVRRLRAVAAP